MEFDLAPEQKQIRDLAREFAEKELAPGAAERDRAGEYPQELIDKMADLGFFGLPVPEEEGGAGAGYVSYAILVEELARACAATALMIAAHTSLGCGAVHLYGTSAQKERWLQPAARGRMLLGFGLTEPWAGSDAGGVRTRARLQDGEWVIDGSKVFITSGARAGAVIVAAVTDPEAGPRGISTIIVPRESPGFRVGSIFDKLGVRASETAELVFEGCRVSGENLLGQRGRGLAQFLSVLDGGRIAIGALSVGVAQACYDAASRYARERYQFGRPIAAFQAISFRLADMATRIELARWAVYRAAWMRERGIPHTKEAAMAKLFASETAMDAARDAVQIHGGYGYTREYPVERYFRDAKMLEIGEGTSEILRLVISRQLGLGGDRG
ncbi:MAG: acyl-CoA dehydrogenase family protein [Bacillota bacterium]|nr:acyl-CoA dehydrogenase family protein [Bacillota bacterium]